MDPNCANNMTGEPNQPNPSSVFDFDPYPPPYTNWTQSGVFTSLIPQFPSGSSLQQPRICMPGPTMPAFPTQVPNQEMGTPIDLSLIRPISMPSSIPNIYLPSTIPQFTMMSLPQQQVNFSFGTPKPKQEVVQFPFELANHEFGSRTIHTSTRCKRKTDSPPLQLTKRHITEEKMAEHMSNLHISSESATSSKESESARTQRLYMCEEMRKLQTESILPQSLMARIQRPCTALVLWKPPSRMLPSANDEADEYENNNEQCQANINIIGDEQEMENDVNNMDMDN